MHTHIHTGLGRTGTLMAIYMIKNQGFTAPEAISWLRIMRPGSVIGLQQHFLSFIERGMWDGNRFMFANADAVRLAKIDAPELSTCLAQEVTKGMDARAAAAAVMKIKII
jgi:hypothetical protein